jgi:hypothetical protein
VQYLADTKVAAIGMWKLAAQIYFRRLLTPLKSSRRMRIKPGRRGGHKCAACLEGGYGAMAPADEHQLAIEGLFLSENRLSPREAARWTIGS